jgi:hypothetical protein
VNTAFLSPLADGTISMYHAPVPTDPFTAKDWHDRANEARMRVELMRAEEAKRAMLDIAAGYERLAKLAEAAEREPRKARLRRINLRNDRCLSTTFRVVHQFWMANVYRAIS